MQYRMGVHFVLASLLISISFVTAQEYVLFDQTDLDLSDADDQNPIFFDQNEHIIQRREAPDTELDGSGNGESEQAPAIPELSSNNETSNIVEDKVPPPIDTPVQETQENNEEKVVPQISSFREETPAAIAEEPPKSNDTQTESPKLNADQENAQPVESKTDLPTPAAKAETTEEPKIAAPVQPEPKEVEPIAQVFEKVADNETAVTPTKIPETINEEDPLPPLIYSVSGETKTPGVETTEKPQESTPAVPITRTLPPSTPVSKTDSPIVPEKEGGSVVNASSSEKKESAQEELPKVTPKVLPSDLAEDESNNQKESESVNDQQSGNAVLFKSPKSGAASQVEGSESDKALQGMAENAKNAKISNEPTEQPSTGESAKNVSRAGKDTTILVVLFVIVIAIGGAAFTHNFIKKRKQNAANTDLVNGIRRSLQNLSSSNPKTNTDVEQGTELKPLMKENNSPNTTKDFTDTKKELEA